MGFCNRRRRRGSLQRFKDELAEMDWFVIAIDGWSEKAVYIERHDDSEEAERRVGAINADSSQDTAFMIRTSEEMLRRRPRRFLRIALAVNRRDGGF